MLAWFRCGCSDPLWLQIRDLTVMYVLCCNHHHGLRSLLKLAGCVLCRALLNLHCAQDASISHFSPLSWYHYCTGQHCPLGLDVVVITSLSHHRSPEQSFKAHVLMPILWGCFCDIQAKHVPLGQQYHLQALAHFLIIHNRLLEWFLLHFWSSKFAISTITAFALNYLWRWFDMIVFDLDFLTWPLPPRSFLNWPLLNRWFIDLCWTQVSDTYKGVCPDL